MTSNKKKEISEEREEIARFALEFSDKYSTICYDSELVITSIIRLIYRGLSLRDLKSGRYDKDIFAQYKIEEKKLDKKLKNYRVMK